MTNSQRFYDEQLIAYLDGESEFTPVAEIEEALKADAILSQRLAGLTIDTSAIKASFDQLDQLVPPAPQLQRRSAQNSKRSLFMTSAAAALALFIGYGAGSFSPNQERDWMDYVAAYHVLYGTPTLSSVAQTNEAAAAQLERVSGMIGKPIDLAKVQNTGDLANYKRAQILEFDSAPLLQLSYLTPNGTPIALCIIKANASGNQSPAIKSLENMASASWQKDGYAYLLIGGQDEALISELTEKFVASL